MKDESIFAFSDYRAFLGSRKDRGWRSRLAQAARCQVSYVSRVLAGRADFSLEQTDSIAGMMGLGAVEAEYLLLLVERSRAGTPSLRRYFEHKLETLRSQQLLIKNRLESRSGMSLADQMTYYSSWIYAAIHMLVSLDHCQSREALSQALRLPPAQVGSALEFLVRTGFVRREGERFTLGAGKIHLERDSPMISKHHTNWRLRSLESLDRPAGSDLHYSVLVGISEEDWRKIHARCVEFIAETMKTVDASAQQGVHAFCLDFFRLA